MMTINTTLLSGSVLDDENVTETIPTVEDQEALCEVATRGQAMIFKYLP